MAIVDAQHLSVLKIIAKLGGSATCKAVFDYANLQPGYDLPSDVAPLQNMVTRMKTHHSLLKHPADNDKVFVLTEKGKKTLLEAVDKEPVVEPSTSLNSKDIAKQQIRDYLRVVLAFADDGGATAEDVLEYVKSHQGFNIPHDLDKICKRLSDIKQKKNFLLDAPKKNNRKSVMLSQLGQDFLNGIDPPKTEKKETIMEKQPEAVPTSQTVEFHLEGLRKLLTGAVKVADKARMIAALDEIINSPALSLEVRMEVERTKTIIEQLEEA